MNDARNPAQIPPTINPQHPARISGSLYEGKAMLKPKIGTTDWIETKGGKKPQERCWTRRPRTLKHESIPKIRAIGVIRGQKCPVFSLR
jgi:hypothetical protein